MKNLVSLSFLPLKHEKLDSDIDAGLECVLCVPRHLPSVITFSQNLCTIQFPTFLNSGIGGLN